jgi:hypothetical protein
MQNFIEVKNGNPGFQGAWLKPENLGLTEALHISHVYIPTSTVARWQCRPIDFNIKNRKWAGLRILSL